MIQRIQSLYLFITAFLSGVFLSGSIFKFTVNKTSGVIMNFIGIYQISGDDSMIQIVNIIPFTVIVILIPLVALITIFLFKNRRLQIKLTIVLLILEILLVATGIYYYYDVMKNFEGKVIPGFRSLIPPLIIILTLLAIRGIKKDENLVRSYERLR